MTQFAPRKRIITHADLKALQQHADFSLLLQFVAQLNDSCQGVKALAIPSPDYDSPLDKVLQLFDRLQKELDSQPQSQSTDSNGRFGSPMYRTWFDQMTQLVWQCFSNQSESAALELCTYLSASFGDRQRIDYGSGHELNFVCFLFCLNVYCFDESEDKARFQQMVLVVFKRYLELMRKLQCQFWLEPAGSHGVWGLDDYHFLPFLFGSSQLIGHKYLRPKSIHDAQLVEELSKDYLYFECISFINRVKCKASLAWHSPMLNDISGVKTWLKVNQGMMKMFRAEVLDKLPIMQHFLVGSTIGGDIVFPSETAVSGKSATLDDCEKRPAPLPIASAIPLPNPDKNTSQIIVKYVQGPDGRQIPIYGRLACSGHQHSHSGQHLDGENAPLDTFALGQEHPTCCGMRIPSAIAASMANQGKLLPFD